MKKITNRFPKDIIVTHTSQLDNDTNVDAHVMIYRGVTVFAEVHDLSTNMLLGKEEKVISVRELPEFMRSMSAMELLSMPGLGIRKEFPILYAQTEHIWTDDTGNRPSAISVTFGLHSKTRILHGDPDRN